MTTISNPLQTKEHRIYGDIWGAISETKLFHNKDATTIDQITKLLQECLEGDLSEDEEKQNDSELEDGEI